MGAGLSPGLADSDPGQLLADLLTSRNENAALKRSLALLRAVVDASGDLAYVKDEKGQYIVANEAMASLLDRSVSQLLGEDDKSLFPADFASQTMDHDRSVMAGNEAGTFEEIALLAGIKHRYISTRAPLRDEQGRVIGVVGISHDDSERFRAQESLKQSERRGDVILESITDGYLVVDRQWRFSQIDPRVQPLLGKGPSELIGKNCWDEFPEIIGTAFEIECRRAMEAGVAATFEAYFLVPLSRWPPRLCCGRD
jgi:PAS domain S-box-containing protein